MQADICREIEILVQSHHSLIHVNSNDDARLKVLLDYIVDKNDLPLLTWSPSMGFSAKPKNVRTAINFQAPQSIDPFLGLKAIYDQNLEILFHFLEFQDYFKDPKIIDLLKKIATRFHKHRGALIFNRTVFDAPASLRTIFTYVDLKGPSPEEFDQLIDRIVNEMTQRRPIEVELTAQQRQMLLNSLSGLTLMEAEKILTKALVIDSRLDQEDMKLVLEAKRKVIEREGVLEYFPAETTMGDVAGMASLKSWIKKRKEVFLKPEFVKKYRLPFPKGILLLGVQGCGKSLCAKVAAKELGVPLLKLDPSNLYSKFIGETEENLKTAMRVSESMAPLVLWIDEIEKAFAGVQSSDSDGGLSRRIFGTFLSWMQEKTAAVFIVATSNDIKSLPPELLRKGRFDEIFFVDLPTKESRKIIFEIHLKRKNLLPSDFDLEKLVAKSNGFSGSEIEQVIISGIYTSLTEGNPPDTDIFIKEIEITKPLSTTMQEKIETLREWAKERTVPAD